MNPYRKRLGQSSVAKNFDSLVFTAHKSSLRQRVRINFTPRREYFELIEINHCRFNFERVIKSSLRQTPLKRHLAALKSWTRSAAGAGALALMASTGGFTVSRPITSTDTFTLFCRSRGGCQII